MEFIVENGLRDSWLEAKEKGRLCGCGLLDNMPLHEIESFQQKLEEGIKSWHRLCGYKPLERKDAEDKKAVETESLVSLLREQVSNLQKQLFDVKQQVESDKIKEIRNEVDKISQEIKNLKLVE